MKSQGRSADIPCPVCKSTHRIVVHSESCPGNGEPFIRRRVECDKGHRYTTYERPAWAWHREEDREQTIGKLKELIESL